MIAIKRAFLVGCYQLSSPMPWQRKLLADLAKAGIDARFLPMPNPRAPKL